MALSDREALLLIREILWPADNPMVDWDSDTIDGVAGIMDAADLGHPICPLCSMPAGQTLKKCERCNGGEV